MAVRAALFGAGRIGAIHAANAAGHPGSRLVAVVDEDPAAAERLARLHGSRVLTAGAALADPDIDAVVIATPSDTHADLVERAAAAGKAIFCEKPIDLDLARVRLCLSRIAGRDARLLVGFNRRHDPHFSLLKQRVDASLVGEVELVTIVSKDPAPPPAGYVERSGGLFRDMTIHDFDMARYLLPEEPVAVAAVGSSLVDPHIGEVGDVDTAVVTLETAGGRIAVITNSRRSGFGYDQRIEVLGSRGLLSVENPPRSAVVLSTGAGVTLDGPLDFFLDRYRESYRAEWAHFVEVAEGRAAPLVSGRDGERAQALAEAALESLRSGRRVEVGPQPIVEAEAGGERRGGSG